MIESALTWHVSCSNEVYAAEVIQSFSLWGFLRDVGLNYCVSQDFCSNTKCLNSFTTYGVPFTTSRHLLLAQLGLMCTNPANLLMLPSFTPTPPHTHTHTHTHSQIIRDIIDSTPVKCKCHGISGACTFQTCYTELPDFSVIGDKLKQQYDAACQVESNGRTGEQFAWRSQCGRSIGNSDFIYEKNLPSNLCTPDPYIGVLGVVGRVCDIHSSGPNSCQNLCSRCNRGYTEHREQIQHQCNCHFHFCCEIRCTPCVTNIEYHTCT